MGLFDLFRTKPKQKKESYMNFEDEILYDDLKRKTDKLRQENREWEKEFNKITSLRQKAQQFEKENKLNEAIEIYIQSITYGEESEKLNFNNYAFDIERVIVLYGKIKRKDLLKVFLEEIIRYYPDSRSSSEWAVRLSKLENRKQVRTTLGKSKGNLIKDENRMTIGIKIEKFKKSMPEFNFYYDLENGNETLQYNNNVPFESFAKLRQFREAFNTIKNLAMIAENDGDYNKAVEAYEKLIVEDYDGVEPYERLIIIYSKLKRKEDEKRAIESAIKFFTELKEKQLDYTLSLARKYGMEKKAYEYINQDKKIFYFGGAFELYNPQTARLNKWNLRLQKLNMKK